MQKSLITANIRRYPFLAINQLHRDEQVIEICRRETIIFRLITADRNFIMV